MYTRIRELGKTAIRGWPGFQVYTKQQALEFLEIYREEHPKKCKPRKKVKSRTDHDMRGGNDIRNDIRIVD